jgi:hypothetical protein
VCLSPPGARNGEVHLGLRASERASENSRHALYYNGFDLVMGGAETVAFVARSVQSLLGHVYLCTNAPVCAINMLHTPPLCVFCLCSGMQCRGISSARRPHYFSNRRKKIVTRRNGSNFMTWFALSLRDPPLKRPVKWKMRERFFSA